MREATLHDRLLPVGFFRSNLFLDDVIQDVSIPSRHFPFEHFPDDTFQQTSIFSAKIFAEGYTEVTSDCGFCRVRAVDLGMDC